MSEISVRFPRVCHRTSVAEIGRVHPLSLNITENIEPLSTASMQVLLDDMKLEPGQFVEICDPYGSLGYYRIQNLAQRYQRGVIQTATMEHAVVTLSEGLVFGTIDHTDKSKNAFEVLTEILNKQPTQFWTLWDDSSTASEVTYLKSKKEEFFVEDCDLLAAVLEIMAQLPDETQLIFNMSTFPWKLIPQRINNTATSEARLSRNVGDISITYDYSQLCTRMYARGSSEVTLKEAAGADYIDADTKSTWGTVIKLWEDNKAESSAELLKKAQKQLAKVKNPMLNITMNGQDLAALTGEPLDRFKVGEAVRVAIPEDGINLTARILTKSYSDIVSQPASVSLTIGTKDRRKVSMQKQQAAKGGGGGGSGPPKRKTKSSYQDYDFSTYKGIGRNVATAYFTIGQGWESVSSVVMSLSFGESDTATLTVDGNVFGSVSTGSYNITGKCRQASGTGPAAGRHTLYFATNNMELDYTIFIHVRVTGRVYVD